MSIIMGLLALVVIAILLSKPVRRPPKTSDSPANSAQMADAYRQGYGDAISQVKQLVADDSLSDYDKSKLQLQIDQLAAGSGSIDSPLVTDQPVEAQLADDYQSIEAQLADDYQPTEAQFGVVSSAVTQGSSSAAVNQSSTKLKAPKLDDSANTLNIILFVASVLVVASLASFIASFGSAVTKLMVVWVAAAIFYIGGISLYHLSRRLRPAALAFVGIGMIVIPLAGMLMYSSGLMSGVESAIVTSSVAVALYLIAATSLRNELIAAVSILALIALVISLGRGFEAPYVLVFSLIIGVSIIIQLVEAIFKGSLPKYYFRPLNYSGKLLPVVALVGSLPYASQLSLIEYEVLVALTTLQYGLYFWRTKLYNFELAMRAGLAIFIVILAGDMATRINYDSLFTIGIGWVLAAAVTVAYGLYRFKAYSQSEQKIELFNFALMSFIWWSTVLAWTTREGYHMLAIAALMLVIGLSMWARVVAKKSAILYQVVAATLAIVFIGLAMFDLPDYSLVIAYSSLTVGFAGLYLYDKNNQPKNYLAFGMAASAIVSLLSAMAVGVDSWWMSLSLLLATLTSGVLFVKLGLVGFVYTAVAFLWLGIGSAVYCLFDGQVLAGLCLTVAAIVVGLGLYGLREWSMQAGNQLSRYKHEVYAASLIMLTIGSLAILFTYSDSFGWRILHGLSALLLAAVCACEYTLRKATISGELALYGLAVGLMQVIWIVDAEHYVSWLIYLHITVAAIYLAAVVRRREVEARQLRLKTATIILTIFLGVAALFSGALYQMLFLVEHIILLMLAVLFSQKWLRTWSAVALTLGLMYTLKDLSYLLMLSIGVGLIIYVVWRLSRQPSK